MSKDLETLIQQLTVTEKRMFKVSASQAYGGSDKNYLQLFDYLQSKPSYRKPLSESNRLYFAQYKKQLEEQIISFLIQSNQGKTPTSLVQFELSAFYVLIKKGLDQKAEKRLKKAKSLAEKYEMYSELMLVLQELMAFQIRTYPKDGLNDLIEEHQRSLAVITHRFMREMNLESHYQLFIKKNREIEFARTRNEQQLLSDYKYQLAPFAIQSGDSFKYRLRFHYIQALHYFFEADFKKSYESFYQIETAFNKDQHFQDVYEDECIKTSANLALTCYYLNDSASFLSNKELFEKRLSQKKVVNEIDAYRLWLLNLKHLLFLKSDAITIDALIAEEKKWKNVENQWETSRQFMNERAVVMFDLVRIFIQHKAYRLAKKKLHHFLHQVAFERKKEYQITALLIDCWLNYLLGNEEQLTLNVKRLHPLFVKDNEEYCVERLVLNGLVELTKLQAWRDKTRLNAKLIADLEHQRKMNNGKGTHLFDWKLFFEMNDPLVNSLQR